MPKKLIIRPKFKDIFANEIWNPFWKEGVRIFCGRAFYPAEGANAIYYISLWWLENPIPNS